MGKSHTTKNQENLNSSWGLTMDLSPAWGPEDFIPQVAW
jgi:hypothetical protein